MSTRFFISIIIFFMLIHSSSFSAVIQGYVTDKQTNEPTAGTNILLVDLITGTASNNKGFFKIYAVPEGKHILRTQLIGYFQNTDTVYVLTYNDTITLNISLEQAIIPIDTIPEIESYHRYLERFKPEEKLIIVLDSIGFDKNGKAKALYSTFYNKTDTPIYLIRDFECLRMADLVITSSKNEKMKRNSIFIDCMGMKENPSPEDFIKVLPHDSVKYPAVYLYFYDFARYPNDRYKIKLNYDYQREENLYPLSGDREKQKKIHIGVCYYYNMALRANIISENYLEFDNSKVTKNNSCLPFEK